MYTEINFKSKKALKDAVAAWNAYDAACNLSAETGPFTVGALVASKVKSATPVRIFQPNDMFGNPKGAADYTGEACVEGPHCPEPHKWYATVTVVNGVVTKVK